MMVSKTSARHLWKNTKPSGFQTGQALLWFLATLAASAAVLYGVYNVGQVTSAKQKTVNAADAGALAGSLAEARALNLMAYGNRAIVANEVFVAQMVSLDSWVRYMETGADNIQTYARYIPYVGSAISAVFRAVQQVARSIDQGLSQFIPVLVKADELFKKVIGASNQIMAATGGLIAQSVASEVVGQNKTIFGDRKDEAPTIPAATNAIAFAANSARFIEFTRLYDNNDRTRARDVILPSRDAFSINRPGNFLTTFQIPIAVDLKKEGGTRLINFDRWEAQDTWSLRLWNPGKWKWGSAIPLGWGRATLAENGTAGTKWGSSSAARLAYRNTNQFSGWTGIPSLLDVRDTKDTDPRIDFVLLVSKAEAATPTTKSLGMAKTSTGVLGSPNMDDKFVQSKVSALAKAEVYFSRPQRGIGDWTADAWAGGRSLTRSDNAKEYGSLYSPFWQARLSVTTELEKEAAALAMGQLIPPRVLQ